jgi:metal-responsive CopG/Arc/MetJ family transcriptional regulator
MKVDTMVGSPMKTAVSLDDALLHEADGTARLLGVSRSRLFSVAIAEFLERRRQDQMLQQLNEVYAGAAEPAERRLLKGMKSKVLRAVEKHR